jgi:GntR family transcriptional regulator
MLLQLDFETEVPIYQQLVNAIIEGIATKELEPNEPLPSVRALASDIGVNMHTVNKAYQLLKNDGFLLIHRQKGVVVNPNMPEVVPSFMEKLQQNQRTMITESICRGMTEEEFIKQSQTIFQEMLAKRDEKK